MFNLFIGILGLIFLTLGSEVLIRGAKGLGQRLGLSATAIGVLIVGYGTSLPELSSSYMAVFQGKTELAVGNVLGSNSFNILFILGISALVTPLVVTHELLKKTLPIMVGVSLLTVFGLHFGFHVKLVGSCLLLSFFAFTLYSFIQNDNASDEQVGGEVLEGPLKNIFLLGLGIALLVGGTGLFIQGATWLARVLGVSEAVIGLSIVAIGTSLPEVFTSVLAALKKERSLVLGNIVGSNIFNLSAVLGGSLLFSAPLDFRSFHLDLLVMVGAALLCVPFFYSGRRVGRFEGGLLLSFYLSYFGWMLLK